MRDYLFKSKVTVECDEIFRCVGHVKLQIDEGIRLKASLCPRRHICDIMGWHVNG